LKARGHSYLPRGQPELRLFPLNAQLSTRVARFAGMTILHPTHSPAPSTGNSTALRHPRDKLWKSIAPAYLEGMVGFAHPCNEVST